MVLFRLRSCLRLVAVAAGFLLANVGLAAGESPGAFFPGRADGPGHGRHIVFLAADDEYRSEESMPLMARILAERHGFDCTVLFAVNRKTGVIDPGQRDHLPGLEALARADLMVVFTRFRVLPDDQMRPVAEYLASGRPVIGLRTATHAFGSFSSATHPADASPTYAALEWNHAGAESPGGFGRQVLGQSHLNHWAFHGKQSTRGVFAPGAGTHPILRGIADREIWGPTDVYEVAQPLPPGCQPLVLGQVLQGMTPDSPPVTGEQLNGKWKRMIAPNDPMLPVAWTYARPVGVKGRVFVTTMGGAMGGTSDFASEAFRRMFVNAAYWTLGLEERLPARADVTPVGRTNPFRIGVRPADAQRLTAPEFALRAGDTVLFYGGGMVERLLESGELEAHLQLAAPENRLRLRSLAWTGDEVGYRLRPEGYVKHLRTLLEAWPANVVVLGYGGNESFAGLAGLPAFREQYQLHLRELARLHPGAKVVLLAPPAADPRTDEAAARNPVLAAYAQAIGELAREHDALFVDLFRPSQEAAARGSGPLTAPGPQLTERGAAVIGTEVARALLGTGGLPPVEEPRRREVALAAAQKARIQAELVRPKNGSLYYGVRVRPEEAAAELPRYHQLVEQAERIVHEVAGRPGARFADYAVPSLPPLPPGKSVPYRFPSGVVKAPGEMLPDLQVADGFAVNLFASEEQFPDLRNPVQLSFDARGRLWVVTMPSFPHTIPGERARDKILILEDTDRDGKADRCTVFADGFDALDGVAFHERGVIVSAQPRLLLLEDTDGDDRADTTRELLRGIDVTDSHHGGMVAVDPLGRVIFSDGVFHRSQIETPFGVVRGVDSTTYRLDPASGRVGIEWQSMTPNPWKVSFDRHGNLFQRYGGGHVLEAMPLTWMPLGAFHPYGHGMVLNYAKGSALSVVSSPNFPEEFQQGVASASLLGNYIVSLSKVGSKEGPLVASDRLDVLWSKNSTFRPADVEFGLDGGLYVSDFSSLIIGHAQHPMRDPQWNHERGRIWRVTSTRRPVVHDWPVIAGASVPQLLALLTHGQNLVRQHARVALRRQGPGVIPAVESWIAARVPSAPDHGQALLEACWVVQGLGGVKPAWIRALLQSKDPALRAAAVGLVRFAAERLPDAAAWLAEAGHEAEPRVQMAVINAVSHLRPERPGFDDVLTHLHPASAPVRQMLADLALGTRPRISRSVPVLEVNPATQVRSWIDQGATGVAEQAAYPTAAKPKQAPVRTRTFRTLVESARAQGALLSVRHGYLDLTVNGVQVLSADSPYSSEQQVSLDLKPGLNEIVAAFRRIKDVMPPVFVSDPLGQPAEGVRFAADAKALGTLAASWDQARAGDAGSLRVAAVPGAMQFVPRELRVKAGAPVRLVFENPDLMPHNLVLVAAGAAEIVGAQADQMAVEPDSLARGYVPRSPQVLQATPLVEPNGRAVLTFTAPAQPGTYPFLCTFPGHWRMMRGELIVE